MNQDRHIFRWGPGYTQNQLDDAQARWDVRFPPDLRDLYLDRRPFFSDPKVIDWVEDEDSVIVECFAWPLKGFWFDVVNSGYWWPEWGEKPARQEDQYDVLKAAMAKAPKLIPIYSHRYIPSEPHEAGNPVFSVYQADVIYYGADLMDYIDREMHGWDSKPWPKSTKHIEFWSLAEQYNDVL